jgi:hypothetical protein
VTTWGGWQAEFLTAAQVPNTTNNRRFLTDWNSHAETNCRDNPVDLSAKVSGSTNCHSLPAITAKAQNYTTHGNAAHAFYVQTHAGSSKALLAALASGNPYTVNDTGTVAEDLSAWGSQKFAQAYFAETAGQRGGGGSPDTYAPRSVRAWGELQKQVNRTLPRTLRHMAGYHAATMTQLRRRSRVRR